MSIGHQQERKLRVIEDDLHRSDPQLAAIMNEFGKLSPGHAKPPQEGVGNAYSGRDGLARAAAWMLGAAAVLAVVVLLGRFLVG